MPELPETTKGRSLRPEMYPFNVCARVNERYWTYPDEREDNKRASDECQSGTEVVHGRKFLPDVALHSLERYYE